MEIGLDMMGGDYAPVEAVRGVKLFLDSQTSGVRLTLIGDLKQLSSLLQGSGIDSSRYTVIPSTEVIEMQEHPTRAMKEKPGSSISIGFQLLQQNKIEAFISAGNTGAMMVGSLFTIKSIPGIHRPTISTLIPKEQGRRGLLLDVGINADCKPENLLQFAILGSLYAKHILKVDKPRVALLNIGEEEGKGNLLTQAAYPLLKNCPQIHFSGNIEGRDIFIDKADVMVCEGFTGNIVLKMAESFYEITQKRQIKDEYLAEFNFEQYGGTPVLGVEKPVIIGHGISKGLAFCRMIELACRIIDNRLLDRIRESFLEQTR